MYSVQSTEYSVQCKVYSEQCTVYRVQCTEYSVQSTVYSVQSTKSTVYIKCSSSVKIVIFMNLTLLKGTVGIDQKSILQNIEFFQSLAKRFNISQLYFTTLKEVF